MAALEVVLRRVSGEKVRPADVAVEVEFRNTSDKPWEWSHALLESAPLVLELRDRELRPVSLPPPPVPRAREAEKRGALGEGQSIVISYVAFLPGSLPSGEYELRFASSHPALGGSEDRPLCSEWVLVSIVNPGTKLADPLPSTVSSFWGDWLAVFTCFWRRLLCWIRRLFGFARCDRVISREVDEHRSETISDAPPPNEAWNGTYAWDARFQVVVDEAACTVTVILRIRVLGTITTAQRSAWETAIENAWSHHFKLCCRCSCCCPDGYTIRLDIQFVTSGEHYVVNAGASTTNMTSWGAADTVDVGHEVGHMLGNLEEYFTVNGTPYGAPRQPTGNIMNNPANLPAAHHYDLVRRAVEQLLGTRCGTVTVGTRC
jgi:hypothetical protein